MTAFSGPVKDHQMKCLAVILRVLLLVGFSASMLVPSMAGAVILQQSDPAHAQMMSMGGHVSPMAAVGDEATKDSAMKLCKQDCLVAAAILPNAVRNAELKASYAPRPRLSGVLGQSLATPPPGRPPKVLMV